MKRIKSNFEVKIQKSKDELGLTWDELNELSGGSILNGHNLNGQIRRHSISRNRLLKICEVLNLDFGETSILLVS